MKNRVLSNIKYLEIEEFIHKNRLSVAKLDMLCEYINKREFDDIANDFLSECLSNLQDCHIKFEEYYQMFNLEAL